MATDTADVSGGEPLPALTDRNTFYGLVLFGIYIVIYGLFVLLNTFWPEIMSHPVLFGVNLAVVYGMGLIFAAFVLAIIYAVLCSFAEAQTKKEANREV
jgi:uncharacterized membrane protein (DUF485 family)